MDKQTEQQLKVKVGVLKRAVKEHKMYTQEVEKLQAEIERLGPDHDKFRQNSQALDESKAMLLDAKNRVTEAKEAFEDFIANEIIPEDNQLLTEGKTYLEEASDVN